MARNSVPLHWRRAENGYEQLQLPAQVQAELQVHKVEVAQQQQQPNNKGNNNNIKDNSNKNNNNNI